MQVQKQIEELLALRASEWLERLPDASEQDLQEFETWLSESRLHVQEFLEVAEVEFCLHRLDPKRQQDVEAVLKRIVPQVATLPTRSTAGPFVGADRKRRWWLGGLAVAASLLAAVGTFVALHVWDDSQRYTTAVGEQRVVQLPDTSVITLNADSQIKVRLEETQRDVELHRGEALFQVAHDTRRPFRVHTRAGIVQAVGTQFNVYDRPDGDTRVSVLEGKVRLTSDSGSQGLLSAGEEADIRLDGSIRRQDHAIVANTVAWRQHRLMFKDAAISDMAAEFNRYNPSVRLRAQGLDGDTHRFDGSFDATDPKALVEMLSKEPDLVVEDHGTEIVIRRR